MVNLTLLVIHLSLNPFLNEVRLILILFFLFYYILQENYLLVKFEDTPIQLVNDSLVLDPFDF